MFTKTYKHEISLQQWVGVPITSELSLRFLKISLFTLDMSGVWSLDHRDSLASFRSYAAVSRSARCRPSEIRY